MKEIDLEKLSMADSISARSAKGYHGKAKRSDYEEVMTKDQQSALRQEVKKSSYVTMCQSLESRDEIERLARLF